MKKEKLVFESAGPFKITRVFINPLKNEQERNKDWNAYEGMVFYFASGIEDLDYALLDENGNDISLKKKGNIQRWHSHVVPLTYEMRKKKNKSNRNFFGKEKEFVDYEPIIDFGNPTKPSEQLISKVLSKIQNDTQNGLDLTNIVESILKGVVGNESDADISIEQFLGKSHVKFRMEFNMELKDRLDFDKLSFLFYSLPIEGGILT